MTSQSNFYSVQNKKYGTIQQSKDIQGNWDKTGYKVHCGISVLPNHPIMKRPEGSHMSR